GRVRLTPPEDRMTTNGWRRGRTPDDPPPVVFQRRSDMRYRLLTMSALLALATSAAAQQQQQGAPEWKAHNLQLCPADIQREVLQQRMREFSFALGVRCQYCHFGGDGISFDGVDFSSDAKPAKNKARAMLKMTDQLNRTVLPQVPSRAEP